MNVQKTQSRELAFQLIYEFIISGEINENMQNSDYLHQLCFDENNKSGTPDTTYIQAIYAKTVENYSLLIEQIKSSTKNFEFDRLYKVDLAILILALAEHLYVDTSLAKSIIINEAINLAKKFSTEKSSSYVNGVLAMLIK